MPLDLIFNANSPIQSENGGLDSFSSTGNAQDQDFVRGDVNLGLTLRPVVPSASGTGRPWDDDHLPTDTYQVAIGNADGIPSGGDWPIGVKCASISSSSAANPTVITTDAAHNLTTGDTISIVGHSGSTPSINGNWQVTVTGANTFTIPANVSVAGTGGFVYDTTGASDLASDISASDLETALNVLMAKHSYPDVEIELLADGSYQMTGETNGEIPQLYSPANNDLVPDSSVTVFVDNAGDSDTQAVQLIFLRTKPVAFAEPNTPFPDADVVATVVQNGSSTSPEANKIYKITLTPGTYAGSYTITYKDKDAAFHTIGVVSWDISAEDLLQQFSDATGLAVSNFAITRENDVLTVEMTGTQGKSDDPEITVTNVDLLAPKGVSGTIALNTSSLFRAFALTDANTLDFTLAVRRFRATGEEAEIFQHVVTLKRNIINVLTMVPVSLPNYPNPLQIPLWRSDITALTGGTPDALDSLPTAGGLYDGRIIMFVESGSPDEFHVYQLINSNDAEDSPGIIRPDDHAASTNEKVWIQRL